VAGSPYPISCTQGTLAAANYSFTFVSGSLTITRAALTVTADNKTKSVGAPLPTFTTTITGFVNGEALATSGVTGDAVCTTTATAASPVGAYPFTCTQGTLSAANYSFTFVDGILTIIYSFTGFFQPVDNLPTLNQVNAGRAIPVKFSLSGNQGLGIFAAGYPASVAIACSTSLPVDAIEETVTAGSSSLTYDPTSDQYHYVWKTSNPWKNSCRQLIIRLNDGSDHRANFQIK
jgi:hypothetical protein